MLLEFQERVMMVKKKWGSVEKWDCVRVTYFMQRSLHKYTRVARRQDGVEAKSMIDMV